jgi:signal peptidase I
MRPRAPQPRQVGVFVAAALAGAVATLLLTILASLLIGQKLVAIGSSTMEPALSDGDLLIERELSPAEAEVDDIITFSEPGTGRELTRRVHEVAAAGDRVGFITRGDSSDSFERFSLPAEGKIGIPTRKVPLLGNVSGPLALLLLLALGLAALAVLAVSRGDRPGAQ